MTSCAFVHLSFLGGAHRFCSLDSDAALLKRGASSSLVGQVAHISGLTASHLDRRWPACLVSVDVEFQELVDPDLWPVWNNYLSSRPQQLREQQRNRHRDTETQTQRNTVVSSQ